MSFVNGLEGNNFMNLVEILIFTDGYRKSDKIVNICSLLQQNCMNVTIITILNPDESDSLTRLALQFYVGHIVNLPQPNDGLPGRRGQVP